MLYFSMPCWNNVCRGCLHKSRVCNLIGKEYRPTPDVPASAIAAILADAATELTPGQARSWESLYPGPLLDVRYANQGS